MTTTPDPIGFPVELPRIDGTGDRTVLDVIDGRTTAVQRHLRRNGLARYEPSTMGSLLALWEIQRPGFVFFDVGANIGLYSALCELVLRPSTVVAFEPAPDTAQLARRITEVNGLATVVEQVAVGAEEGELPLYLSARSDASNSMVEGFKHAIGTETVRVRTLDHYVDEHGVDPDVIKMDVEGFEPEVIAGARRVLERRRPALVVEVLHRRGYDHGPAIERALDGLGYHAYRLSTEPTWVREPTITGELEGEDRDWLLLPEPLPVDFPERFETWRRRLDGTEPEPGPAPDSERSTWDSIRVVHRSDGLRGVVRAAKRRLANMAASATSGSGSGGRRWTRDDVHERSS